MIVPSRSRNTAAARVTARACHSSTARCRHDAPGRCCVMQRWSIGHSAACTAGTSAWPATIACRASGRMRQRRGRALVGRPEDCDDRHADARRPGASRPSRSTPRRAACAKTADQRQPGRCGRQGRSIGASRRRGRAVARERPRAMASRSPRRRPAPASTPQLGGERSARRCGDASGGQRFAGPYAAPGAKPTSGASGPAAGAAAAPRRARAGRRSPAARAAMRRRRDPRAPRTSAGSTPA